MKEHDAEAEEPFFERFDCRFPYSDREAASALIRRGFEISLNGAFGVLEEICRPPPSANVSHSRLAELLDEWRGMRGCNFHPLAEPVTRLAATVIQGVHASIEDCLGLMRSVGQYPAQRAALNIVGMATDPDDERAQVRVDDLHREIRSRWDRAGI